MISEISNNDEDRISNFKLATLVSIVGVLLGPSFSIFIDNQSQTNPFIMPFLIATMLGILNFVVLWFNFKRIGTGIFHFRWKVQNVGLKIQNIRHTTNYHQKLFSLAKIISSLFYVFTNTNTRLLSISFFFLQFGLGLYGQSLSLFLLTTFLYTPQNIGTLLVVTSGVTMISMYILQPLVTRYYKYQFQIKINLIFVSLLLILYAGYHNISNNNLKESESMSLLTLLMIHLFIPFIELGFTNLFANSVDKSEQGKIMGGSGQISSLAAIISGLLIGRLLVESYSVLLVLSAISLMLSYIVLSRYLIHNKLYNKIIKSSEGYL